MVRLIAQEGFCFAQNFKPTDFWQILAKNMFRLFRDFDETKFRRKKKFLTFWFSGKKINVAKKNGIFLPKSCSKSRKDEKKIQEYLLPFYFLLVFFSSWLNVEDVVDIFVATLINLAFFEFFCHPTCVGFCRKNSTKLKKTFFFEVNRN